MKDQFTSLAATVADVNEETGTIEGVAVRYNVDIPRGPGMFERVQPGAFTKQIADPARVSVLWQHDSDAPIGKVSALEDGAESLRFTAKISENADIPEARKALALLREGIIDEISVGFQWGSWVEERSDDGDLTIAHTKARLRELSVVTFGALGREARVLTVAAEVTAANLDAYRARFGMLNS